MDVKALEVFVMNPVLSACGYPTGVVEAQITGGVPLYTVLWNTGDSAPVLENVLPGIYSVTVTDAVGTQATGQGEVFSQSLMQGGQTYANLAHCSGAFPMVDLNLHTFGQYTTPRYGSGPYTITGPASLMSSTTLPCLNCQDMDSLVRVEMDVMQGSTQIITWTNGSGCTGESTVIMSTEVVWPQVWVTDMQGACSNGANGAFTVTIQGGAQFLKAKLYRPNGTLLSTVPVNGLPSIQSHAMLAPGDYQLQVITESSGPTDDEQCGDMTTITVPDLGATCGNVNGRVFVDGNANCAWTFDENSIGQAIVEFTPGPYYASSNALGLYSVNLPFGTYDHTITHPGAQQECPGPFTLSAVDGMVNEPIGCASLYPLDGQVTMVNGPARPGFEVQYAINARNNTLANAGASTLTFVYDANLNYASASPAPSSIAGNTLTWDLNNVSPYITNDFHVYFTLPPDVGLIGTVLNCNATLTTTNTDGFLANNTWNSAQVVTGSFDPNNKIAQTSSRQSEEFYYIDADEYIDYTLNFQNTGSDTAFLVVVTDTLPATLDPASIQVGAASHPFSWSLAGAGVLTFNFVNIQLPDSNVNEFASHGFVSFRIKPRLPILPGTVIENRANIYFDFNEPVITEPSVLVAEFSTGVDEGRSQDLRAWPSPADDVIMMSATDDIVRIAIYASDGRMVRSVPLRSTTAYMFVADLPEGFYVLVASTRDGSVYAVKTSILHH